MVLADRTAVFDTPAGPVTLETPAGVHAISPSTLELARRIDVRPGERVVELGCGSGLLSIVAAKLGARQVVAVDLDERACRATAENARRNGVALDVRRGSFLEPLRAECFDLALFNPPQTPGPFAFGPKWGGEDGALHFRAVLPRIGPHLRPGGRVLLLVLGLVDERALAPLVAAFDVDERGETDRPFEPAEYEGYARGLVGYLEERARSGGARLERLAPTRFCFKNRYLRLRARATGVRLVVNADDLGLDVAQNEGIVAAFERGIVRSASLVANGPAVEDAAARLGALAGGPCGPLDVGLHANLSQGRALAGAIAGLTSEAGDFAGGKHETWRRLEGLIDEGGIARELLAQLSLLEARGVRVSHVDGHQHVHAFPAARGAAIALASSRGLWLRVPDEPALPVVVSPALAAELETIRRRAAELRAEARAHPDVRVAASFRGLAARAAGDGVCGLGCLRRSLAELPERGLVELMVHPQAPGRETAAPREAELRALCDPTWPDWLAERGIALTSFLDAARSG